MLLRRESVMWSRIGSLVWRSTAGFQLRGVATVSTATRVGIVGCGNVGNAVAFNLRRKGFQVLCAYDPVQSSMDKMPEGVKHCANARQVAEEVDVVVSGLPKPVNVIQAAEGPDGILAGLSKDKVWVDHSTTDYEKTQQYAEAARKVEAHVLEAPISGGLATLKKGNMVAYIGGNKEVADAVWPLLEASYMKIVYTGEVGSAMTVKVVSNMLASVQLLAMSEVLMLAKRSGIDLKLFWEAIRLSAGQSFLWDTGAPMVFSRQFEPGFTMELLCKDLQLGYDMARKYEVPMAINQLTMSTFRAAQYQYGDDAACYIPPKALEDALGVSLEDERFKGWTYENEIVNEGLVVKHSGITEGTSDNNK